jgi:hypothetical protein
MIFFESVIDHARQCMNTMRLNQEEDGSKKFETFLSEQSLATHDRIPRRLAAGMNVTLAQGVIRETRCPPYPLRPMFMGLRSLCFSKLR